VRAVVVAVVGGVWASLFTCAPLAAIVDAVVATLQPHLPGLLGWGGWDHVLATPAKVVAAGVMLAFVPVALHGPARAGLRLPTPTGMRLTVVGFLVVAVVEVVFGWQAGTLAVADAVDRPAPWMWLGVDVSLMAAELLVAQVGVLALALPLGLPDIDERRRLGLPGFRSLAGLGVGPLENARLPGPATFLAVPVEAWPAIGAQAVVYAVVAYVPVGLPVVMAVGGGVAAGWLTVRTGSVWPALVARVAASHVLWVAGSLLLR
jgi:hypothetical protein